MRRHEPPQTRVETDRQADRQKASQPAQPGPDTAHQTETHPTPQYTTLHYTHSLQTGRGRREKEGARGKERREKVGKGRERVVAWEPGSNLSSLHSHPL